MNRNTLESAPFARRLPVSRAAACVVEALDERKLMAANYDLGVNINNNSDATFHATVPALKELGVKSVRLWIGVGNNFDDREFESSLSAAIKYGNAGFDVMMIVHSDGGKVTDPAKVKGWFNWALGNKALKNAVDRWEVGNEPDLDYYWKGTFGQYVNNFLKPASEVLRAHGEKVMSAGPSWNPDDVKRLIDLGALNYVDFVGFHPYAKGETLTRQRIEAVEKIVAGRKPLVATEWNTFVNDPNNNTGTWAKENAKILPKISQAFAYNYYFALIRDFSPKASTPGPAGLFTPGYAKTVFYNTLKNAMFGGSDGGGDDGSEPSSRPSVAKVSLINADTNQVIIDSLANGQTINASQVGTRNLALVATTASGTRSVKFVIDGSAKTENTVPFASFGDNGRGDIYGKYFANGSHSVSVTPYGSTNAQGTVGTTRTFTFNITSVSTGTPAPTTPSTGGPAVQKVSLFNADTNKVITGYDSIDNGDVIDFQKLGVKNVTFVTTTASGAQSVKMTLNGTTRIEDVAPYAYFGDGANGDVYGSALAGGSYTFTAQAYTANGGQGSAGAAKMLNFKIVNGTTGGVTPSNPTTPTTPSTTPAITGYKLIDAYTGKDIAGHTAITATKTIDLSQLPTKNLAVVALTNAAVSSVRFNFDGKFHTENGTPFAATGNSGSKYNVFTPSARSYWVGGTPYTADNSGGTAGKSFGVTLRFVP
jgi:hypothetical protein